MAQGVVYQTADRKIASANPAAERILGLALDQMQGQPSVDQRWKVIHEDGSDFSRGTYPSAVALKSGREVLNTVIGILNPENNSLRWINVNAIPQFKPGENKPYQVYTTFEDITERKRAQEALRESEGRYKALFSEALDGICLADAETGKIIDCNEAMAVMVGRDKAELIGQHQAILHPSTGDKVSLSPTFRQHLADKAGQVLETQVVSKTGEIREVEIKANIMDLRGVKMLQGMFRDITERKRAEKALRESEENFHRSLADSPLGIRIINADGKILYANQAILDIYGYDSIKELKTTPHKKNYTPESYTEHQVRKEKRQRGEYVPSNYEISIIRKDGEIRHLEVFRKEVLWNDEKQFQVLYNDITERKRAEEALRESEKKYRLLAENASDVITVMDMNMRPIYMSPSITRLLGYSVEEAMARGIENGLTPKSLKVATKGLAKTIAAELKKKKLKPVTVDFELTRKDGSTVWVAASVALIRGSDGQPTEILSILHDISERKKAEEALLSYKDHLEELVEERTTELDKAKLIAEEASKAKSEFLANMSHEIRTPLSSIIGFSELLADEVNGLLNNDQKKYLGYVTSSGQHLLSLINDILDLSKVEAGKMELQPTSFSISDLLKNSSSFIAEEAMKHNIRLLSEIPADVDVIEADERKVKQIIYNLLSNAVKFTPDGGSITTKADIVSPDSAALPIKIRKGLPDTEYVLVSVKDTGIGIAKKDQSKLFTEFHQIENPYTKKYEGTGLGLALSRKLVTLHGGRIWFESKGKGKGCTFYFILPLIILPNA
jgi:PAS domain S-box-containing protein